MSFLRRLAERLAPKLQNVPARSGRKAPRVRTDTLDNIRIETSLDSRPASLPIQNLSTTGAGLVRAALDRWPQRGDSFEGELCYGDERILLTLNIVHISPTSVGVTFERPSSGVRRLLEKYFSIEISALELRPVRQEALKALPEGKPMWLTGPGHTELYYVRADDGSIERLEIMLFGNRFTSARNRQPTYEEGGVGSDRPPSSRIPDSIRNAYLKLVESLDSIPAEDRTRIIETLRDK